MRTTALVLLLCLYLADATLDKNSKDEKPKGPKVTDKVRCWCLRNLFLGLLRYQNWRRARWASSYWLIRQDCSKNCRKLYWIGQATERSNYLRRVFFLHTDAASGASPTRNRKIFFKAAFIWLYTPKNGLSRNGLPSKWKKILGAAIVSIG